MSKKQETPRPRLNSTIIASMDIIGWNIIPDSVQVFYSTTRKDRAGALILDMLMAHAFSWTLGRHYGGVCGPLYPNANDHRRMIQVLGLQDELVYPMNPLPCERFNGTNTNHNNMVLPRDVYMKWKDTAIFTPEWINYIRQRQQLPTITTRSSYIKSASRTRSPSSKSPKRIQKFPTHKPQEARMIVHVRRGDVTPCMGEYFRYVPNSHYLHLIQQYITSHNDTQYNVTIYSESKSFESWQDFHKFSENVSGCCTLSLDGDMADVWRDMLGFDDRNARRVLILSMSSFSLIPAILADASTTTVVYTPFWHHPLPHWQVVGLRETKEAERKTLWLRQTRCSN